MMDSLFTQFGHKIKTAQGVRDVIGALPRSKKAIMCHGVFDVVHPGHMRHLLYAKSKADILIASITADRHITKGHYRPHVPQALRAANLAAFEMVDYVIIDPNTNPLENIALIQPDYFAKGYEYVSDGMPAKTTEEKEVLESYGGEIIFTPGDVVYSSSRLIDIAPPQLALDKLLSVMHSYNIGFIDLRRAVDQLDGFHVHVVGDTIVDSLTRCAMIGGQTKTPTMSVLFEEKTDYVGGAGIVAKHIRAAGAEVTFSTVLGKDDHADLVKADLRDDGINCQAIIDETRPTTNKNAIVANGYRLLKVDTLDNSSVTDHVRDELIQHIREIGSDAIIFSDFRHGIFNSRTIPSFIDAIPAGRFKVADSQVASRWGNITEFKGFDLITPNEREARFALADQDSGVRPLAGRLFDETECALLILKLGERGVITYRSNDHDSLDAFFALDSFVDDLVDAVGAGDALLAYSTLALLATKSEAIATIVGAVAAACECEYDGNIPIKASDVVNKINRLEQQTSFR